MGISAYIKEIGRGKAGARSLSRAAACDLMAQVLDGQVSDLEIGAFCLAMRVKGETTDEMTGFLDAVHARLPSALAAHFGAGPVAVLPSYNGARKLPNLTPLLAGLLAQRGVSVLVHGPQDDAARTTSAQVWQALQWPELGRQSASEFVATNTMNSLANPCFFIEISDLCPGLATLLAVRRVVGVRNSAHSLVKLMNPLAQAMVVGSYTHPEYLSLMSEVFVTQGLAMLLRGTEGEPVADARRCPQMDVFAGGVRSTVQVAQAGSLAVLPQLPTDIGAQATAAYTRAVLAGDLSVPAPIARQVDCIAAGLGLMS